MDTDGLLSSYIDEPLLEEIQRKLYKVGGYFADEIADASEITAEDIVALEYLIDFFESQLEPLKAFIMPIGSQASCLCHVCRMICRRAERRMIAYKNSVRKEI